MWNNWVTKMIDRGGTKWVYRTVNQVDREPIMS